MNTPDVTYSDGRLNSAKLAIALHAEQAKTAALLAALEDLIAAVERGEPGYGEVNLSARAAIRAAKGESA